MHIARDDQAHINVTQGAPRLRIFRPGDTFEAGAAVTVRVLVVDIPNFATSLPLRHIVPILHTSPLITTFPSHPNRDTSPPHIRENQHE